MDIFDCHRKADGAVGGLVGRSQGCWRIRYRVQDKELRAENCLAPNVSSTAVEKSLSDQPRSGDRTSLWAWAVAGGSPRQE